MLEAAALADGLPGGLRNLGATCYANAVMQCLAQLPSFVTGVADALTAHSCLAPAQCVLCATGAALTAVLAPSRDGSDPPSLGAPIVNLIPGAAPTHRHEDAHEFWSLLLSALAQLGVGAAVDTFEGSMETTTTCSMCLQPSTRREPFRELRVVLDAPAAPPPHWEPQSQESMCDGQDLPEPRGRRRQQADTPLVARLNAALGAEVLQGSARYACAKCFVAVRAERRSRVVALPPVLAVQVLRFGPHGSKLGEPVQFDEQVEFVPAGCVGRLAAVLVHHGASAAHGHYTAFVRRLAGGWVAVSDLAARPCAWAEVQRQPAYLLLYRFADLVDS